MSDEEPTDGNGEPVALAATEQPVPLVVSLVDDERVPDGMVCMATWRGERMIARVVMPPEAWAEVERREWFSEPRQVVLVAREGNPGLQCQLFAVLPMDASDEMTSEDDEAEPWAASVPSSAYEKAVAGADEEDEDEPRMAAFPLGNIVRFAADRVHPDDLALEAVDVLRKIIDGRTTEVVDRALRDLLGGSSAND